MTGREQLADDVLRLSLPYPSGFVNVYLVLGPDGARLIDTGHHGDASRAALRRHLAELGVAVTGIREILLTHAHPDHVGGAVDLAAESGATVRVHTAEVSSRPPSQFDGDWLRRHGLPEPQAFPSREFLGRVPAGAVPLNGDETLRFGPLDLRLIVTPGHSPGLLCLYEPGRRWLFSTDQVLRVPTPLSLHEDQPDDPVGDYLDGLRKLECLAPEAVLPGHGRSFADLPRHLEAARRAQEERVAAVLAALPAEGAGAYDLSLALGWAAAMPPARRHDAGAMVLGRVLAYLRRLEVLGQVRFEAGAGTWRRTT